MTITIQLSAVGVTEALVNMYNNTWHDFVCNSNLHKHRCEHLKFHEFCQTSPDSADKERYLLAINNVHKAAYFYVICQYTV